MASDDIWILGINMTKFGKHPDKDTVDLASQAAMAALADGGVTMRDMGVLAAGAGDDRRVAPDRARFLQHLDAAQACRGRQPDLGRKRYIGDPGVAAERSDQGAVDAVHGEKIALVRRKFRGSA